MTTQATTLLSSPAGSQWRQIGVRHHHGINLPLFSLRTQSSCGIGEYPDLYPLLDWCQRLGLDVIQLLPLNDGGPETSPYCSLSGSALNPIHLGLAHLPSLEKVPEAQSRLKALQQLSASQRIDYPLIQKEREAFLRHYYHFIESSLTKSHDFHIFNLQNRWLDSYALFKAIKHERQWQPWEEWPEELRHPNVHQYQSLLSHYKEEISFQSLLQYLCFHQLALVKKKAEEKGIFLKGDIPILINRESADVWHYPSYFSLNYVAGAPPDQYSKEGQSWGFPLYNWETIENHNYDWWIAR